MRITTRIALGLALVTGLAVAALGYQLSVVQKLQAINRELSLTKLEAARISLRLLQRVDGVQEFVAKSLVLGDADYFRQWEEWEGAVDDDLERLHALELVGPEWQERVAVDEAWTSYRSTVAPLRGGAEPETETRLEEIDRLLEEMRARLGELMTMTDAAVATHARNSAEAGDRAQVVSRIAAGSALLLGTLICLLLYLSISGRLRKLTRGTRELALGRFDHRLEVRGEDELSELARDFNRMARRLSELEDLKRDFVSHVSHELKGPLAAIHETILVLLDEIAGPLTDKQTHFLKLSQKSSERLAGMISNLLQVSRLEAGGAEYVAAPHDLEPLTRSVLEEYEPVAGERGITLSLECGTGPAALLCDGERIREVIANLVGNAIKFSPPGSTVRLQLSETPTLPPAVPRWRRVPLSAEEAPFLLLCVADEGIGVPAAHKEGIFEKFHQVRGGGRLHGQGVGLGLSISRRIVEAHGGAIWVEDNDVRGSVFFTLLPRVPSRWRGEGLSETPPGAPRVQEERRTPTRPPEYTRG